MKRTVLLGILLLGHSAITARAMMDFSYLELFAFAFSGWPAGQLFSDLTVALVLVTSWMISDARKTGRNAWPFVGATVLVGSFSPLAYLLWGAWRSRQTDRASSNA